MIEKIKNLGNLPLVIILVVVIIIAIVLSVVKGQKTEGTNANANISDATKQEKIEEEDNPEQEDIIFEENVQEIVDESEDDDENIDAKYFIRVNYGQNVVTIYTKDSNGEYTVPYKAMVCSTGTATPRSGTYTIPSGTYSRGVWGMMIGNVWAQYFTRIKGSILFHSVPYTERNKWSLEYWEYDKLGTAASAGCIRLTVRDAKWIYNNCPAGTQVEFYTDSNPGPLGKPTAQKISEEEKVRGWDPTDPDVTNPWRTYEPDKEEPEEKIEDTTTNNSTTNTKPNKNPTTTTTPEEEPKDETPEQNQGGETTEPNEGNPSGENQNPEEVPEEEITDPNEGQVDEPQTPPVDQEPSSGDENNSEVNTGNNNEENGNKEEEISEVTPDTPVENINSEN